MDRDHPNLRYIRGIGSFSYHKLLNLCSRVGIDGDDVIIPEYPIHVNALGKRWEVNGYHIVEQDGGLRAHTFTLACQLFVRLNRLQEDAKIDLLVRIAVAE